MKKVCYLSIIISYFLLGFILIYFNKINPNYEGNMGLILSIIVIAIWLVALITLVGNEDKNIFSSKNKIENWLCAIALAPVIAMIAIPILLFVLIYYIPSSYKNRMKNKCKILLAKGFILSKEKRNKKTVHLLTKENFVIKICEFDIYEISLDCGDTFTKIDESSFISYDDKIEIENIIYMYKTCDYRDKDIYEPTVKIIDIMGKYFD